jgi:hypothetical protein
MYLYIYIHTYIDAYNLFAGGDSGEDARRAAEMLY